jgi:ATP-dependent DNA helicase RecQ
MRRDALLEHLKQHFGYDSFRPLQEEIISDSLAGKDVFALLPTGGGKSLCYQLPALIREGLTVVVSPLIALMKDQVDALVANGVAATFLNSTLREEESKKRWNGLFRGEYRLLYVAPERLMMSGFQSRIAEWPISLVAIDEAHCISEWGHDFRPEYRQLSRLRKLLPDTPIMALTATATSRVRDDILRQLHLRDPRCYVASFNRPNLTYRVAPKRESYDQLQGFIRSRSRECGIIYCQSRKGAESLADRLAADGVAARPYHAGLTDQQRSNNQEAFLRDDIRVICATIAFGMGINKPNVRFVVHYDLPKNIEGYYQETGRAGRDGLPSDCLLFFTPGDVAKYQRFIAEMTTEEERRVAQAQLRDMVNYAECSTCRRSALLAYFGETYPEPNCGTCDNCLAPRTSYDGTVPAQKLLSTILRAKRASRDREATFGLTHHIEVLQGMPTERITKWGHNELTTYGIGADIPRPEWQAIGRELIRLGLLSQTEGKFHTLDVTPAGIEALRSRTPIMLTRPLSGSEGPRRSRSRSSAPSKFNDAPMDDELFETLRHLRREFADARNVPAYIIFSDATLRDMAAKAPTTEAEMHRVNGMGEKKYADFGAAFLQAIRKHVGMFKHTVHRDERDNK